MIPSFFLFFDAIFPCFPGTRGPLRTQRFFFPNSSNHLAPSGGVREAISYPPLPPPLLGGHYERKSPPVFFFEAVNSKAALGFRPFPSWPRLSVLRYEDHLTHPILNYPCRLSSSLFWTLFPPFFGFCRFPTVSIALALSSSYSRLELCVG